MVTGSRSTADGEAAGTDAAVEARTRSILDRAHEAFISMDAGGFITGWNPAAEKTFGWSREEAIGRVLADTIIPASHRDAHWRGLRRFLETGKGPLLDKRIEITALHRDGHELPVELTIAATRSRGGYTFDAFLHDITDRRTAEEEIALSRELALAIGAAETVEDALGLTVRKICEKANWALGQVWVRAADGSHLECSPAWYATSERLEPFRRKSETITFEPGVGLPGRVFSTKKPAWIADVRSDPNFPRAPSARAVGLVAGMAFPILARAEVVAVLEFFVFEQRREDERFIDLASSVAAQLGTLVKHKEVEDALRESEARYRLLADSASDVITLTDPAGVITYASPASRAFGYEPEELVGRSGYEFIHPDDLEQVVSAHEELLRSRQPLTSPPYRLRHKDGTYAWIESTVRPILDPASGEIVELRGAARDITKRKQAEEALQRSDAELRRSNKALEQFAYDAAHDLGTPLKAMSLLVTHLADKYTDRLGGEDSRLITAISDNVERMQMLITDLLEYSRVSREPPKRDDVDCFALLEEIVDVLDETIKERGARVTCDDLPTVRAHASQLAQVFQNLLSNALKFSDEPPPEIYVSAEREDGSWRFSVSDNGVGIPPEQTERVFELFRRLHPRDAYAGTGVGLSICKRIVEGHGGRIWAEPNADKGSTFYFTIPDEPTQ